MTVGRNEPCPCGSGKKYKKCCLLLAEAPPSAGRDLTPAELVRARGRAFAERDFGFIFDTYHPDSNFRLQFPDRAAYIRYGRSTLAEDFQIRECRILKERIGDQETRVLFYLDTLFRGERSEVFESSLFLRTEEGWRYHSSQKLERTEFPGEIEAIDWEDFERVGEKIFF
jgi:SEC-C motif-containing protein